MEFRLTTAEGEPPKYEVFTEGGHLLGYVDFDVARPSEGTVVLRYEIRSVDGSTPSVNLIERARHEIPKAIHVFEREGWRKGE